MLMILIQSSFMNMLLVLCAPNCYHVKETTVTKIKPLLKLNTVALFCLITAYTEHRK